MKKFFSALLILATLFIFGCQDSAPVTYERSEKVMGTLVTLKATGQDAQGTVDESFAKIFEFVENVKVDVKNLNDGAGNGEFVKISPAVFEVLKISQEYAEKTNGAFDVTIGAAVDLWKVAKKNKILPTPEEIDAVKNLVGYKHLHLDEKNGSAYLDTAGVKINLGGVGKGYGVDIARKIFIQHKISDGLIDFGTSTIYAFGKKNIGVKNPRGDGLAEVLEVENAAISTSGDYENFFEIDGKRYHHIINPVTCMPAENSAGSSTVIIPSDVENCGTVADILSTANFIQNK
ncbi:MAG: FAD:protein FMN transferase [Selenomonadaceae bacterium]|nr:FAD:protein FMN transferase [Selenomonadaceae bacterium]